jgi:hypothetical protein
MRVWANSLALCALGTVMGTGTACDTTPRGRDAAAQSGHRIAEVSVRIDAPNGGTPTASVLAFRATLNGVNPEDVLPAIDPLVVQPPEGACVLRDVAASARALGAQGGRVALEALDGLALELGQPAKALPDGPEDGSQAGSQAASQSGSNLVKDGLDLTAGALLRPTPRVFPNLASVVDGVFAEADPTYLTAVPTMVALSDSGGVRYAVPAMPRLQVIGSGATGEGGLLPAKISATSDLTMSVAGTVRNPGQALFVELRPLGSTWALACPVTTQGPAGASGERVVVPVSWLGRLAELKFSVSVEAVARESHLVQLGPSSGGTPVRLTLEVRSSSVVELVP